MDRGRRVRAPPEFANPTALVRRVASQGSLVRARPGRRIVVADHFEKPADRFEGTLRIMWEIAKIAGKKGGSPIVVPWTPYSLSNDPTANASELGPLLTKVTTPRSRIGPCLQDSLRPIGAGNKFQFENETSTQSDGLVSDPVYGLDTTILP